MACPRLPYSSPHAEHHIKAAAQPWAGPFVGQMQAVERPRLRLHPCGVCLPTQSPEHFQAAAVGQRRSLAAGGSIAGEIDLLPR